MSNYDVQKVEDWSVYVGWRCLVVKDELTSGITEVEVEVLEVSPSGNWVKFDFSAGCAGWEKADSYLLIEKLGEGKDEQRQRYSRV